MPSQTKFQNMGFEEKEIKMEDFKLIKKIWPFIKPFFWSQK